MCFTNLNSKAFALSGAVRIPQIVGCGARSRRRESKTTSKIMRTTFFKAFKLLLVSFGLWASNARACDVFCDFNGVDPQTLIPPPYDQFGRAHWVDNGDGTGYVSITDAGNGQVSVIIFRDCDAGDHWQLRHRPGPSPGWRHRIAGRRHEHQLRSRGRSDF